MPCAYAPRRYKAALRPDKTLVLAFMAGAYIALGTLVAVMVGGGSPGVALSDPGLQKWLYAFMFPFGLVLIIIVGGELVTSNMSIMTLGVVAQRVSLWRLARNWLVVYLGNFAGSLFVAAVLIQCTDLAEASPWHSFLVNGALKKVHLTRTQSVLRGIGCNWLVCLAVWSAQAAEDITGKILAIWFPITAFVAVGFEHCVAQMAFIPAAMMLGADISVGQMLGSAVIPVTIGNIIGALLVALPMYYVYWLPNHPVDIARCDFGLDHCWRRQHPARAAEIAAAIAAKQRGQAGALSPSASATSPAMSVARAGSSITLGAPSPSCAASAATDPVTLAHVAVSGAPAAPAASSASVFTPSAASAVSVSIEAPAKL